MSKACIIFRTAAIVGIAVLLPQYFMETRVGIDYPPPITHVYNYYGFIGVALAWQIAFFVIARDPVRFRPMMIPAILEKISFGGAAVGLFLQQRIPAIVFAFGMIDLMWCVLFVWAYRTTPSATTKNA
ncbi:MAG: hypothetical protein O2955_20200 [Planctomycetota bacterium]|nr:hypothetical protein [Planctomycetota bacterium]MDA1214834.1 hypothetical protein [Planctomycetota bacterium]